MAEIKKTKSERKTKSRVKKVPDTTTEPEKKAVNIVPLKESGEETEQQIIDTMREQVASHPNRRSKFSIELHNGKWCIVTPKPEL